MLIDIKNVLERLNKEKRLECLIDSEFLGEPICPKTINNPRKMCAGCVAKIYLDNLK